MMILIQDRAWLRSLRMWSTTMTMMSLTPMRHSLKRTTRLMSLTPTLFYLKRGWLISKMTPTLMIQAWRRSPLRVGGGEGGDHEDHQDHQDDEVTVDIGDTTGIEGIGDTTGIEVLQGIAVLAVFAVFMVLAVLAEFAESAVSMVPRGSQVLAVSMGPKERLGRLEELGILGRLGRLGTRDTKEIRERKGIPQPQSIVFGMSGVPSPTAPRRAAHRIPALIPGLAVSRSIRRTGERIAKAPCSRQRSAKRKRAPRPLL
jgi:hypothetical protein